MCVSVGGDTTHTSMCVYVSTERQADRYTVIQRHTQDESKIDRLKDRWIYIYIYIERERERERESDRQTYN